MTFSIFTAKLTADCHVTLRSVVKMANAERSEHASESESSDYANCSSSDDSLGD